MRIIFKQPVSFSSMSMGFGEESQAVSNTALTYIIGKL